MDTSALIGTISEIGRPDLIDCILKLGYTLAIAGHVRGELRRKEVREEVEGMVRQGKIRVFAASPAADIEALKKDSPALGPGESDTLALYERVRPQGKSYCILDDRRARSTAKRRGIPFTGLLGLIVLLRDRGIISSGEASEIVKDLRHAGFWMPAGFSI